MSEDKFTAIIVGAGPAGSTAAYLLAREGHEVLLIEKGTAPGAKNMFGGRMYTHALNRIIGEISFDYAGCLECGTCRVVCPRSAEALKWSYPRGGFGVQFRFG